MLAALMLCFGGVLRAKRNAWANTTMAVEHSEKPRRLRKLDSYTSTSTSQASAAKHKLELEMLERQALMAWPAARAHLVVKARRASDRKALADAKSTVAWQKKSVVWRC